MSQEEMTFKDCPICMDPLSETINRVVTECGHAFHTMCLMKSVATNGFACPCCRSTMAEIPMDSDDESEWENSDDFETDDDEEENDEDNAGFYGMRRMFAFETDDDEEENDEDNAGFYGMRRMFAVAEYRLEDNEMVEMMLELEERPIPPVDYIVKELENRGFTTTDFVKNILLDHAEYEDDLEDFTNISDNIFGQLRIIISNYTKPESEHEPEQNKNNSDSKDTLLSKRKDECIQEE